MAKSMLIAFRVSVPQFESGDREARRRGLRNPNDLARQLFWDGLEGYPSLQLAQDIGRLYRDLSSQMQSLTSKQDALAEGLCHLVTAKLSAENDNTDDVMIF